MDIRAFFASSGAGPPPAKRQRVSSASTCTNASPSAAAESQPSASSTVHPPCDPRVIVTWNCNGLAPRLTSPRDRAALCAFVRAHDPDVICLQEARLKAHCSNPKAKVGSADVRDRGRPRADELQGPVGEALRAPPLDAYRVHWSLADGRAAGTALLVHTRLGRVRVRSSLAGARAEYADAEPRASPSTAGEHHPEGRLQYVCFRSFDLLQTYVPNRGWTPERCAVRRAWDEDMQAFIAARRGRTTRPLLWTGDLNVAHTPADSSNEEVFRAEWDRDGKRFVDRAAYLAATPETDRGIPGFSDGERARFTALLHAGGFADAWRHLHPAPEPNEPTDPGAALYTWRGTPAAQQVFRARYEGMAQRLDYFLLSEALQPRLRRCDIMGHGAERKGFLGSDHCPVLLELAPVAADVEPEG